MCGASLDVEGAFVRNPQQQVVRDLLGLVLRWSRDKGYLQSAQKSNIATANIVQNTSVSAIRVVQGVTRPQNQRLPHTRS